MQDFVYIKDLSGHVGREVVLRGWVYNTRFSGKIGTTDRVFECGCRK